jgi:hypothetical protein
MGCHVGQCKNEGSGPIHNRPQLAKLPHGSAGAHFYFAHPAATPPLPTCRYDCGILVNVPKRD